MYNELCKQCGCAIILGGRFIDQDAQEHGFCREGCREVHESIRQFELKEAAKGIV